MTAAELDQHRYVSLATFRRDGAEVATPVWFAEAAGKLYVFTAGESGKVKRLRRSSRARIAPCDARGGLRGSWQDASAQLITDGGLVERARAALRAKYGLQLRIFDFFARLAGRAQRRAWIQIEP
jgi:PPOX class probable F420-dependent enzyme